MLIQKEMVMLLNNINEVDIAVMKLIYITIFLLFFSFLLNWANKKWKQTKH
jgi:hypothetical protein